jgi:fructose-1,6-bisphosphatase
MTQQTTLTDWLDRQVAAGVDQSLAKTIAAIAAACAEIALVLRTAPIDGLSGATESTNIQGETQKPLDIVSNDIFIKHLQASPQVSILVSEELSQPLHLSRESRNGRYIVACDPLDGSSNLDVNVTVGSIFSVLALPAGAGGDALLQPGTEQLAAGYAAYGNSTSLVLTFGRAVAVFTLDADGRFILTEDAVAIPEASAEYAINTARERFWDEATRAYVAESVAGETGPLAKRYNMRWVGSMVADIHRILMRGGIFLYPVDSETREKGGRLRLMYEANPMAMIVEAAGGAASTGHGPIRHVQPTDIHQRIPVILGSREEVERIERHYRSA